MITRTLIVGSTSALLAVLAAAQYGSAPNNFYPDKYNGSTFTGVVTETKDDQIVLFHIKSSKTEVFTGRLEAGCSVPAADKSGHRMMPSDIPKGTVMTAFFNANTKKIDRQKVKENLILAITFDVWQGQKIPEEEKMIYFCTNDRHVQFKAWAN